MRLGIFGGSFDPVHNGHLLLAECCLEQQRLDELWLVPTSRQPFKPSGPAASDADRLAMLGAATDDRPRCRVSTLELDRGGVSYTVDTLAAIAAERPGSELFLAMGADTLAELPQWREHEKVCQLATPMVVARAGYGPVDFGLLEPVVGAAGLERVREAAVTMPAAEVSSSGVREAIAAGQAWRHWVPSGVAEIILSRGLYGVR